MSPLRQCAAAKPSHVTNPNSPTNTMSAGQLTWCMSAPHPFGGEVDDGGEARADDHPEQLVPIKEGDAVPLRLDLIVERGPEHRDGLHDEQQVPPAPLAALRRGIHGGGCYAILVGQE